jgi:hypothetical protein
MKIKKEATMLLSFFSFFDLFDFAVNYFLLFIKGGKGCWLARGFREGR